MDKSLQPELRPRQEQRQSYRLTYLEKAIPSMLSMNTRQLNDFLRFQSERNPCLELTFSGGGQTEVLEELAVAADTDFRQDLLLQLPTHGDPLVLRAARLLIGQLEESGYLPFDPVAAASGAQRTVLEEALALVQSLEPAGVGARSLRECYLLQAGQEPERCADVLLLISDEALFQRYKNRDFSAVCRALGWTQQRLDAATKVLSTLPMRPLEDGASPAEYIIPDAEIVQREDGGYAVRLIEGALPALTLSQSYLDSLSKGGGRFANEGLYYARRLMFCFEHRNATLLGLLQYAVERQATWLNGGPRVYLPISEAARLFSITLPTASRALRGKYLRLRGTVLPASALFCRSGTRALSQDAACTLLRQILEQEPPDAPMSDQLLSHRLFERCGVLLSRRTVAKYRASMDIPSAARRRRTAPSPRL